MALHCVRGSRQGAVLSCPGKKACFHSSFCSPAVAAQVITFFFFFDYRQSFSKNKRKKGQILPPSICLYNKYLNKIIRLS